MKESNNKIAFNLFGGGFQHAFSSTGWKYPKNIVWDYNSKINENTFYVDNQIQLGLSDNWSKNIFGWINESPELTKNIVSFCIENIEIIKKKFTCIFTHENSLLDLDSDLFKFSPCTGTWIVDMKIFKKSRNISMISSNKNFTNGHKIRIDYIDKNKEKFDLFGRGFREINNKLEGLKDYRFSICIENGFSDHYFTEKILDCFATGTVPVYMGAQKINQYFERKGIIFIDDNLNLKSLNEDQYKSMIPYVRENFQRVKEYKTAEDWLFKNYLSRF